MVLVHSSLVKVVYLIKVTKQSSSNFAVFVLKLCTSEVV